MSTTSTTDPAGLAGSAAARPLGPVTVIGATGKTGRLVVEGLRALGVDVAGRSRRSDPPFDWDDRSGWPAALAGARALYVTYVPDLAVARATDDVAALLAVAREAGVEQVVLLSGRGEAGAERAEQLVAGSGLRFTLVRAAWFGQNFTEGALLDGVLSGVVALPTRGVAEPFVDTRDIADVVVAALTQPGHDGRLHELTGPRSLTFAEAAAEIAAASGRPVQHLDLPAEDFRAAVAADAGAEYAAMLTDLCEEVFDGRNVAPTDGVPRALGRPARDFRDLCREAAAAGVWR